MLFVNQSTGKLTKDILEAFVQSGYNVTLFTGRRPDLDCNLDFNIKIKKSFRYRRNSIISRFFSGFAFSLRNREASVRHGSVRTPNF